MARKKLEVLNVMAFADLMGVASNSVTKWIKTGKISDRCIQYTAAGKPNIIVEYAVEELQQNETKGAVRRTKTGLNFGGNTQPDKKVAPPPGKDAVDALLKLAGLSENGDLLLNGESIMDVEATTFDVAKTQEQIGKAEMIKLLLKEKRGQLVDKEATEKQMALLGYNLKSFLNTFADRCAAPAYVAAQGEGTELDVRNVIHTYVEQLLIKFSGRVWE